MFDPMQLLLKAIQVVKSGGELTSTIIAHELGLDVNRATTMKSNDNSGFIGASLEDDAGLVDVVLSLKPTTALFVTFKGDVGSAVPLAAKSLLDIYPRRQDSRISNGYALIYELPGMLAGVTASSDTNRIESIFCERRQLPS